MAGIIIIWGNAALVGQAQLGARAVTVVRQCSFNHVALKTKAFYVGR